MQCAARCGTAPTLKHVVAGAVPRLARIFTSNLHSAVHCQVLHRAHTAEAPVEHNTAGGKAWDTVKPLGRHFRNLARVVLIDDDAFKVQPEGDYQP